ncbi:MAG: hypothetical protein PHP98_09830 [Kiritimatiellae bacterium]|nr:hypothetical protein [Kiritimatiellia bacterium]
MEVNLNKARQIVEVLLVRLGLAVLPLWPRRMILAGARLAGTIAYHCASGQRRLTMANLEIAFGPRKSKDEKKRIAVRSFQNMALVFLDFFWFARNTRARVRKYVRMDASVPAYFPQSPPTIGVTAHFGNWELMSRAFTAHGYLHAAIVAPLSNPAVDVMFNKFRAAGDAEIIPIRGAVRGSLRAIRRGLHLAILLDQNTKPENGGVFVDFFGLPCPISTIAAVLVERKKVPILPVFCRAQWDGHYTFYAFPQFKTDLLREAGPDFAKQLTQQIAASFQREIEKHPEQWMWMYKRWKYINPGSPADAYPYYAKPLRNLASGAAGRRAQEI